MCGIAGFVNLDGAPAEASVLGTMTDMIRHRGPDDRGTLCLSLRGGVPDTALGFHRLKILDLSARGHQPMTNPDGSIALLFNGEIYDAFDYKAELERGGYRFRSGTDTEVILALYEREGLEWMLERLNGMFAIVIADTRRGAVHLVRDRVGIKPLYWAQCGTTVLFASEAKAFLAHPAFRAEIDPMQVDELLAFRYVAGHAHCSRACAMSGRAIASRSRQVVSRRRATGASPTIPRSCACHGKTRSIASTICWAAACSRNCGAT